MIIPEPAEARGQFETLTALLQAERYDEAREFAAGISANDRIRAGNVALVEALILKRRGELERAAGLLDEIVARDPASSRARQELAHTLFLIGDDERARYHFEYLKETMNSRALTALYDRYLEAIRNRRPWTLSGSVGFAPSTNINDGTPGSTVFIGGVPFTNENAALSGVGLSYGLSGSYRFRLDRTFDWVVGASVNGSSYARSRFDRLRLGVYSEIGAERQNWRLAVGLAGERALASWKGYGTGFGPYVAGHYSPSGRGRFEVRLSWMRRNYDVVSAYDGYETNLSLAYRHIVTPRLVMTAGVTGSDVRTTRGFTSYLGARPTVSADYFFSENLILHANAAYENRLFRANFPLTGEPRRDHRFNIGAGATLRGLSWNGLVPRVNYEFSHVTSNVDLFERRSHSFSISLNKKY